jgi:DNA polymerase III alpha subunit
LPHITRGSAGSCLVCYLMGITDVDPVAHDIPLARFLNPLRDDLFKY